MPPARPFSLGQPHATAHTTAHTGESCALALSFLLRVRSLYRGCARVCVCVCAVVPKANNVFTFVVSSQVVTLYGNNFTYRSSDRSARKFKSKPSVEL